MYNVVLHSIYSTCILHWCGQGNVIYKPPQEVFTCNTPDTVECITCKRLLGVVCLVCYTSCHTNQWHCGLTVSCYSNCCIMTAIAVCIGPDTEEVEDPVLDTILAICDLDLLS